MEDPSKQQAYTAVGLIEVRTAGRKAFRALSVGPGFWEGLPSDPAALAEAAKRGEGIVIILAMKYGRGVKDKYGPFVRQRLLRRFDDWRRDRVAFIRKYSPRFSAAMRSFERDKARVDRDYRDRLQALPEPPEGYYWKPDDSERWPEDDFDAVGEIRQVRLWNDAFGPMPPPWHGGH